MSFSLICDAELDDGTAPSAADIVALTGITDE